MPKIGNTIGSRIATKTGSLPVGSVLVSVALMEAHHLRFLGIKTQHLPLTVYCRS